MQSSHRAPWRALLASLVLPMLACAQDGATTQDPFPPLNATADVIRLNYTEFATLPGIEGETGPARPMLLVDEPGTRRLFVNDMRGVLYSVSYDGKTVTKYLDLNAAQWSNPVQYRGAERGFQSFAFHPDFGRRGRPGYGKFYTYFDATAKSPNGDFKPSGNGHTHDTLLLEWTAKDAAAPAYEGAAPRELMRFTQPYGNHNGGQIAFNPLAAARDADFGLLCIGSADGGSGGDPMNMAQNLQSAFGKIFRIDPAGRNSANGKYGIPGGNPFAQNKAKGLPEIYAYGVRNPQRLFWDSKTKRMYMSDIGQNAIEEISQVTAGANLGWNVWEGSHRYAGKGRAYIDNPRADPAMVYPTVEYDHTDALLFRSVATIGGFVYRHKAIAALNGKLVLADNPSGEIFYVNIDTLPATGSHGHIRRVLLSSGGSARNLLQVIQEKKPAAARADLRFGEGPNGRVFLLNKQDNIIREVKP